MSAPATTLEKSPVTTEDVPLSERKEFDTILERIRMYDPKPNDHARLTEIMQHADKVLGPAEEAPIRKLYADKASSNPAVAAAAMMEIFLLPGTPHPHPNARHIFMYGPGV